MAGGERRYNRVEFADVVRDAAPLNFFAIRSFTNFVFLTWLFVFERKESPVQKEYTVIDFMKTLSAEIDMPSSQLGNCLLHIYERYFVENLQSSLIGC